MTAAFRSEEVEIVLVDVDLSGQLLLPPGAGAVVVFAHGSGSSRFSPRNLQVARSLAEAGLACLLFDLLSADEEAVDLRTRALRFDIDLLASRLVGAIDWVAHQEATAEMRLGLFGASTGAAAALIAAARRPERVGAVVSRGGRPDLAAGALPLVAAPVLLVVGERDEVVHALNREAGARLTGEVELEVVPGATHLFEEPGALEQVADLAARWFRVHLTGPHRGDPIRSGPPR